MWVFVAWPVFVAGVRGRCSWQVAQLAGHTKEILHLAWNPTIPERYLLSVAAGGVKARAEMFLWDVAEARALRSVPLAGSFCSGVDWSGDGKWIAITCQKLVQVRPHSHQRGVGAAEGLCLLRLAPRRA